MLRIFLLFFLVVGGVGCDAQKAAPRVTPELGLEVRFPVRMGPILTQLRVAATELDKARGLMGTVKLPEAEGMAFMYETEMQLRFWMKDTPLDLDIAFVARDGTILEIKTMTAGDTETTVSSSDQARFAVEMRAGWFGQFGLKPGDKIDVADLRRALTARGFEPTRYLP